MSFEKADNTIVLSDFHLSDEEPPHPKNPLWKKFKTREFFIDEDFKDFIDEIQNNIQGPIELVLNGDIFDFDSILKLPKKPPYRVSWLEKIRGLSSEENKSRFKMNIILDDHFIFVETIREFIKNGNKVVFIIGNHDMELHWLSVREEIINRLDLNTEQRERIRFCEWFFVSNGDTLIEHGNQYDEYCVCNNPIHPIIKHNHKFYVRLPFGNLAGKIILNGMGLMNPHVDSSFIKSSAREYIVFFYRYVAKTQPFLLWSWIWSAAITLVYSVREGLLPAMRDPLLTESRVGQMAKSANTTPQKLRALRDNHVHPAIFDPLKILRELWLDRVIILIFIFFIGFQVFTFFNVFIPVSIWWFAGPILLLIPPFIFYAQSVESEVDHVIKNIREKVPASTKILGVNRAILGHTHKEIHTQIGDIEFLNTGTWSPAFHDVECTKPYGRRCFAWIRTTERGRESHLFEWTSDKKISGPLFS